MDDTKIIKHLDKRIQSFSGNSEELESAIGTYIFGRRMGWKPLYLMHDKKTLRKYEEILGLAFRDALPETGDLAHKSVAWQTVEKVGNFWKAVTGNIKGIRTKEIG